MLFRMRVVRLLGIGKKPWSAAYAELSVVIVISYYDLQEQQLIAKYVWYRDDL